MSARARQVRPATAAARRPATRRPAARARRPGVVAQVAAGLGKAVRAIPIPAETLRRIRNWTLAALVAAGLVAGTIAMGVPQTFGLMAAHMLGAAGLSVRNIEVVGRGHVDRDAIYRVAMDARGQDMPLVDLAGLRRNLLGLPWVEDARVSRRLPDTLVVDIVEKRPAAIWQYRGQLELIDAKGAPIAGVDSGTVPDQLPLVIGPGANGRAAAFQALVASQPVLKPLVEAGTWVGGRRWDLLFTSGETLSLPEGDDAARKALATFARRDVEARLLGRGIVRFDMRDPERIVAKMSREPGYKVPDPPPPPAAAVDAAVARTVT